MGVKFTLSHNQTENEISQIDSLTTIRQPHCSAMYERVRKETILSNSNLNPKVPMYHVQTRVGHQFDSIAVWAHTGHTE